MKKRQYEKGNFLSEHALQLTLIVTLTLSAILGLGSDIRKLFQNVSSSNINSYSTNILGQNSAPEISLQTKEGHLTFTTEKGTTVDLSMMSDGNISSVVATLGANGATNLMADMLHELAAQLLATGEISQAQYQALINLSNKGHELASVEAQLKQLSSNSTDPSDFSNALQQIPGLIYPHSYCDSAQCRDYEINLGYTHGYDPNVPISVSGFDSIYSVGKTQEFMDAYQQALAENSMQDPAVKELVDTLSENIVYLSQITSSTISNIDLGYTPSGNIDLHVMAALMHQDSDRICNVGNGVVDNLQCLN